MTQRNKNNGQASPADRQVGWQLNHPEEKTMRLHLSALKVHLAHCAAKLGAGRYFGLTFTASGLPGVAAVPSAR